jgi:hypothetical protein
MALAALLFTDVAVLAQTMDRAHLRKKPFKIYDGHLTADQKRCLQYALKQWVMYDQAPVANGTDNRNETNDHVTAAGPNHATGDAKDHARSSRSMSEAERDAMKDRYGASSPFHADGQPVKDPTQPNSGWFTDDEGAADISVEVTDNIPGEKASTAGKMEYGTEKGADPVTAQVLTYKGKLTTSQAILWMKNVPKDKTWCYPTDSDADGWITNKDTKCPKGTLDYYMIIKHELGHYFSFTHAGNEFQDVETPTPSYETPGSLCSGAMSPQDDHGGCEAHGSEFTPFAVRLYFASNRPGGLGGSDIWYVSWDETQGRWADPQNCGAPVNTPFDEKDPYSEMGDALLHFASNRPGGLGGYDLYTAERNGHTQWDSLAAFIGGVNGPFDETGPTVLADRVYFASNRPGGMGGFDLYMARLSPQSNHVWQAAQNLGPQVNSSADELAPAVGAQQGDQIATLYYASNRAGGLGQLDLWKATMQGGLWHFPQNLGPPINSPLTETDPCVGIRHDHLYFTSDQPGGHGGTDVFHSRNLADRVTVQWDGDIAGIPGATVLVEFDVTNTGFAPFSGTPQVTTDLGWATQYDPAPLDLAPQATTSFPVLVSIPVSAGPGDSCEVTLQVSTPTANDQDHAFATVPPSPAGIGGHGAGLHLSAIPNPHAGTARIRLALGARAHVRLELFDLSGRVVRTMLDEERGAGFHAVEWDGRDARGEPWPAGVVFCRLTAGAERRQITLVRLR